MKHITFPNTDTELELPHSDALDDTFVFRLPPNGGFVVGYLAPDDSPMHPLDDCDGQGRILSFNRDHPNFCHPDNLESEAGNIPTHLWVQLSYFEHGSCVWDVQGGKHIGGCPDMRWDGTRFAGVWLPDPSCRDRIESTAISKILTAGTSVQYESKYNPDGTCITRPPKPGESPYFTGGPGKGQCIDERFSNVITITLPDGSKHVGFKTFTQAYQKAAELLGMVLNPLSIRTAETEVAVEYAAQACEVYTKYCNGECYGYVAAWFDADGKYVDHDSCWGYFEQDYAESERNSAVESAVKQQNKLAEETAFATNCP